MRSLAPPLLSLLLAGACLAQEPPTRPKLPPPPQVRGMSLTMHSKDPSYDYAPTIAELPKLGVTHVCVMVHFYQRTGRSPLPARHPLKTPTDEAILKVLGAVRRLGMQPALMPIVLLEKPADDEWRGNLSPPDRRGRPRGHEDYRGPYWDPWWRGYRREILHFARLAQEGGATLFSVGSELSSVESLTDRWKNLIADVRRAFSGRLTYSANWDHYRHVKFWQQLDCIGLSGYYELTKSREPTQDELDEAWVSVRTRILDWRAGASLERLPLLFMEIGYPSLDGGAAYPWDYTQDTAADLQEQRMAYQSFVNAWRGRSELLGVYFYEWWGEGGIGDKGYTPRRKPAEDVIRAFYGARGR